MSNVKAYQSQDPVVYDTKLGSKILFWGLLLLIVPASLGLTTWPGVIFPGAFSLGWSLFFYTIFANVGFLFTIGYFLSYPTLKECLFVALGWLIIIHLANGWGWRNYHAGFMLTTLSVPCTIAFISRYFIFIFFRQSELYKIRLKWLVILIFLFVLIQPPSLALTGSLHPQTLDLFAFNFDLLLFPSIIPQIVNMVHAIPGGDKLMNIIYDDMFIVPLMLAFRQLNGRPFYIASVSLVWVMLGLVSVISYHLYPAAGTLVVFGSDFYIKFSQGTNIPISLISVPITDPRNCMPSMHFGWLLAVVILYWRSGCNFLWKIVFVTYAVCLAISTLYVGGHYLIDLIVAVPVTLGCIALSTTGISLNHFSRKNTIVSAVVIWLFWIILLRTRFDLFLGPWTAKSLVVVTMIVVICQAYWISYFKQAHQTQYN